MADCIVNISGDSPPTTLESQTTLSTELQAPLIAVSSSPSTIAISEVSELSTPPIAYRWYLQESEDGSSSTERSLTLDEEYREPVNITASKKLTKWKIPLPPELVKGTLHDIVLGVSTQKVNLDAIESILIRLEESAGDFQGSESEVIKPHELKRLSASDGLYVDKNSEKEAHGQEAERDITVFRWKLFNQSHGLDNGVSISVEINTWPELPLEYGSLDLHFVELCADSTALYKADPFFREHCPHSSWLVDVNRSGCPDYDSLTKLPKQVRCSSYSGDGRFAAIKTLAGDNEFLEVWDLMDYEVATVLGGDGSEGTEKFMVKPHRATPVAWIPIPKRDTDISISWDGSFVAVMETEKPEATEDDKEDPPPVYQSMFTVYKCSRNGNGASEKPCSRMSLVRHDVGRTCPGLRNYIGDGVFHMIDNSNPHPKDELFVACDGITINIYSTFEDWNLQRSIVMDSAFASRCEHFDMACTMSKQLRGRYLVTTNDTVAFTFDIDLGTLVSFSTAVPRVQVVYMNYYSSVSADGLLVAIPGYRHVDVYRTQTWTLQGSYVFDEVEPDERVVHVTFTDSDRLLYVMVGLNERRLWHRRPGYILDVERGSVVGRVAPDGSNSVRSARLDGSDQGLIMRGYTKLWYMRLEDRRTHRSPTGDVSRCTDHCNHPDSVHSGVEEGTSPCGLRLKVQKTDTSIGSQLKRDKRSSVTVTMTHPTTTQVKKMVVPLPRLFTLEQAAFFADCRYLVVVADGTFMAWSVPATFEGDFRLQMILQGEFNKEWTICPHGIVFRSSDEGEEGRHHVGFVKEPCTKPLASGFMIGISKAIQFYELADVGLRQDILRYYGRHINTYPDKDDESWNVLNLCALFWDPEGHHTVCNFTKDLLSFPGVRWVPLYSMSIELNPLATFLTKAETEPLANVGAQIIVDYCLRQAKAMQDPHFLSPILQCLPSLVDSKQLYSEMAQTIYRELAFFPSQGRDFIVANHTLINPWTFRWKFWQTYPWGLHQYRDQVLQFNAKNIPNPPKGNFTRDIFQASFDLLWHKAEDAGSQDSSDGSKGAATAKNLFSWPHAIWTMVLRKCKLRYNTTIQCYPFELETLDNPALMALVEYKWNTIGFKYWFVRFLGQMCYYIMVLTAIFLQIKRGPDIAEEHNGRIDLGLESLFVAIIVVAFVFLWLEFVQLLKDKQAYIRSVYNMVDLLVFLLPLAGAINQILIIQGVVELGLNPGLLSFSVLFIFLHFLFELRVFQAVCHFVSIIIRAIYAIRVFFFVFAGGLLAFSIAIVHLYHVCTSSDCSYYMEGFTSNLLRAFSMTYFMMGGNYDPVENGFAGNNFAFHMMMIVFFFFTVILMLNVLIALINNAIDDGDQTWQLDWLEYRMRYVESAENMSYDIPGFREKHNHYPDTIYYTGTPQQVREYQKKTMQMRDDSAPGTLGLEGDSQQQPESIVAATATAVIVTATPPVHAALGEEEEEEEGEEGGNLLQKKGLLAADLSVAQMVETKLRNQFESERASSEKQIGELQQQLREQQDMMKEQQKTLKEQQQVLMQILSKLER
ncbi:hypothetical protein BKA57DRAFT_531159 [Linnemannia elongata]|nr:hypothetical protein BKA57DRAFT_531159 [Linnemannia elongata]